MLSDPTESQLESERHGKIMIYDRLKSARISQVMDTQFDRIESMMFVRTIVTDAARNTRHNNEPGDILVEDDGC